MPKSKTDRVIPRYSHPTYIIVMVEWVDASYESGPVTRSDLDGLCRMKTAGWLVAEDEERVSIAADHIPEGDGRFRNVTHIPKTGIISRMEFDVRRPNQG